MNKEESTRHALDEYIQKSLNDLPVPSSEMMWGEMKSLLQQNALELPSNSLQNSKIVLKYKIVAFALGVGLLASLYFMFYKNNQNIQEKIKEDEINMIVPKEIENNNSTLVQEQILKEIEKKSSKKEIQVKENSKLEFIKESAPIENSEVIEEDVKIDGTETEILPNLPIDTLAPKKNAKKHIIW